MLGILQTFGDEVEIRMAAVLGKVKQCDPENSRSGLSMVRGLSTDAEKKRSLSLWVVGPSPFKLLRNLVSPAKLSDKTFEQLVTTLTNHYSPNPSKIEQRFRFHSRQRELGEGLHGRVESGRELTWPS